MKNLIITTISLCMNVFVLFLMFKIINIINIVKHESQERISLLGKKNYEIIEDLKDVKKVASKLNVKIVTRIVRENNIDYEDFEEITNLNKIVVCVVFKDIAYKNELLNPLQMCLEDLEEEGYKYKLVDGNLEITI